MIKNDNNNEWIRLLVIVILLNFIFSIYNAQYGLMMKLTEQTVNTNEKTEEEKPETVDYILNLKKIENNKEVWETYNVNVIDARPSIGMYTLDNSKTDGLVIQLKFNDNKTIEVYECTEDMIKVRHLATLLEGSISIKAYDKIELEVKETEESNDDKQQSDSNESVES